MSKVWFVTGSSRGLGSSIIRNALAAGDRVVGTARDVRTLDDLVTEFGDAILPITLDVADPDAVQQSVSEAVGHFGRLDVVVNNAGYGDTASVEDTTLADFRAQIDTNFYGTVYVSKAVLPVLRTQGTGHIVQVSSLGGRIASPGLSAYQSAKWAVGGFSTALAQEVAPLGIKVTVIEPGGMRTDWAGSSMTIPPVSAPYEQTVGAFAAMLREHTATEASDPDKVAALIRTLVELPEPPLRLLVGTDAVEYSAHAAATLTDSDARWHELSVSVGYDQSV